MTNSMTPRDWEAISAYLDGELNKKERVRLEQRLQSNAELRRAAEDLSRMRSMLRSQPKIRAPRNFTLTPAMAGVRPRPAPRGYPFLRLASAVASLLFVMVLASDLLIGSSRYAPSPAQQPAPEVSAIAPMAAPVLKEAQGESTAATEQPFEQGRSALAPQGTAVAAQGLAPTATPEVQALMAPNLGAAALPTETAASDASAMSVQEAPLPPDEPMLDQSPEPTLEAQQQAYQEQTDTGGPLGSVLAWRLVEGLLVLIAVATATGAYLLRRAQ